MLLVLLTSLAFSSPPNLGKYEVEPWRHDDPSQLLSIFDSAAARNQTIRMSRIQRDSAGKAIVFDTTTLWTRGSQLVMEERRLDIEESPAEIFNYQAWLSRELLTTDSGRLSTMKDGVLTSESSASSILDGGLRILRTASRSSSAAETSVEIDSGITVRDGRGHVVSRSHRSIWTTLEAGVLSREERMYQTDSILWNGDVPQIWWEDDSSEHYTATPAFRSTSASHATHHLTWDGARLLADSAIVSSPESGIKDSIRTIRCSWKDTLLQACTQNGETIVEMRHDRFGRPTYLRSDIDNIIDWWTYDSIGRIVSFRERQMRADFLTVDSTIFGEGPWPTRELNYQCDSLGQTCHPASANEYSFAYLDAIGVSPRTSHHERVLARRSGNILVMTDLPREPAEVRIVDASGRQLSRVPCEGASTSIALPSGSGPLFWTISSSSGQAPASGSIPSF